MYLLILIFYQPIQSFNFLTHLFLLCDYILQLRFTFSQLLPTLIIFGAMYRLQTNYFITHFIDLFLLFLNFSLFNSKFMLQLGYHLVLSRYRYLLLLNLLFKLLNLALELFLNCTRKLSLLDDLSRFYGVLSVVEFDLFYCRGN